MNTEVRNGRLLTLDALRGVAAIAVVLYHIPSVGLAPRGYLAVDFFFLLSGYVIARTYDARIAGGLSFGGFVAARVIRLYPLYLVGLVLGATKRVVQIAMHRPDPLSPAELAMASVSGLFMLPFARGDSITPLNDPSWSLVFEMAINLVYAVAMIQARRTVLLVVVLASAVALAFKASTYGSLDFGYAWDAAPFGFARVAFGFTFGVLMARVDRRPVAHGLWPLALAVVLGAALCMPVDGASRIVYDLAFAFVGAPAIVWFGAAMNPASGRSRSLSIASRWLGDLSYPIYVLHYPLLGGANFLAQKYAWSIGHWAVPFVLVLLVVCFALSRGFDHPIRSRLNARLAVVLGHSRRTVVQAS